ncbi:hypothetical protein LTR85_012098 [Meristemomyces frigidus]|nr:hypothetical protein LTR85_012098 [Meristemomyces frigidus]
MNPPNEGEMAAAEERKILFITLPNELIANVTGNLELPDLLKLRLILPKSYHVLLLSLLHDAITRLYVMPTQKSMSDFNNICNSPFFQAHIKEVVFIPKTLESTENYHETFNTYASECREEARYSKIGFEFEVEDTKFMKRSWSVYQAMIYEHASCIDSAFRGHVDNQPEVDKASASLIAGLRKLPQLDKVSVCAAIDAPGLNIASYWYTDEYAIDRIGRRPHVQSTDDAARLAACMAADEVVTDGAEVFLRALCDPAVTVPEMKLADTCSGQLPFYLERYATAVHPATMQTVAQKLTTLAISCTDCNSINMPAGREVHMWMAFVSSAVNLQSLKVYIGVAPAPSGCWERDHVSIIEHVLRFGRMPSLQHLEIIGQTDKPGLVNSELLSRFVQKHRAMLHTVRLSAILFKTANTRTGTLCGTVRGLLDAIRTNRTRAHFSMTVYRRDEHGKDDCQASECWYNDCEWYRMDKCQRIHRSELEQLAKELDATLKDGFWDFGEYVTRREEPTQDF